MAYISVVVEFWYPDQGNSDFLPLLQVLDMEMLTDAAECPVAGRLGRVAPALVKYYDKWGRGDVMIVITRRGWPCLLGLPGDAALRSEDVVGILAKLDRMLSDSVFFPLASASIAWLVSYERMRPVGEKNSYSVGGKSRIRAKRSPIGVGPREFFTSPPPGYANVMWRC